MDKVYKNLSRNRVSEIKCRMIQRRAVSAFPIESMILHMNDVSFGF